MTTGIIVALPAELTTLTTQKLQRQQYYALNANTLIILSGMGVQNAEKATCRLITLGVDKIISWGCAGALSSHLNAGDLIIPRRLYTQTQTFIPSALWQQRLINSLSKHFNISQESIVNSPVMIKTRHEKHTLQQTSQAVAVDMESASIAQVALAYNIPFIVLRSIVDPAYFNMPTILNTAINAQGTLSLTCLLPALIAKPTDLFKLIQLGYYFHAAKRTLTQLAIQLPHITSLI